MVYKGKNSASQEANRKAEAAAERRRIAEVQQRITQGQGNRIRALRKNHLPTGIGAR